MRKWLPTCFNIATLTGSEGSSNSFIISMTTVNKSPLSVLQRARSAKQQTIATRVLQMKEALHLATGCHLEFLQSTKCHLGVSWDCRPTPSTSHLAAQAPVTACAGCGQVMLVGLSQLFDKLAPNVFISPLWKKKPQLMSGQREGGRESYKTCFLIDSQSLLPTHTLVSSVHGGWSPLNTSTLVLSAGTCHWGSHTGKPTPVLPRKLKHTTKQFAHM